jgi:hypothetical protein
VGKLFAAAVVAIVLLTAGALLLVYRLTEPSAPGSASAERAESPASGPAEQPSSLAPEPDATASPADQGVGAAIELPGNAPSYGPVPNESPPIQGPAPVALPTDPDERADALGTIRKQRVADQMERLNRRNQQRGGTPATGGKPAAPPRPAP